MLLLLQLGLPNLNWLLLLPVDYLSMKMIGNKKCLKNKGLDLVEIYNFCLKFFFEIGLKPGIYIPNKV
jgi:hypothetical protein